MGKIIVLQGLPASGKTSLAKELISQNPNCVRVNKDSLREMAFFSDYTPAREGLIDEAEFKLIDSFLAKNRVVIVDDTNLSGRYNRIQQRYKDHTVQLVPISTPLEECIKRDCGRSGRQRVGKSVITNMALLNDHVFKKPVVIIDVDGTLADLSHRLHHVKQTPKQWGLFFEQCKDDKPRVEIISAIDIKYPSDNYTRVLLSGRPDNIRNTTEDWLDDYFPNYDTLIMRNSRDHRDDSIVKKELYQKYLANQNVVAVFDDRPRVLRVWKELGIPEINDVGPGVEF